MCVVQSTTSKGDTPVPIGSIAVAAEFIVVLGFGLEIKDGDPDGADGSEPFLDVSLENDERFGGMSSCLFLASSRLEWWSNRSPFTRSDVLGGIYYSPFSSIRIPNAVVRGGPYLFLIPEIL